MSKERKLKKKRGFSMAETLMTVLLMSITLLVITGGASVIQRSYNTITLKSNAMSLISTVTTAINADLRSAKNIQTVDGKDYEDTKVVNPILGPWFYSVQRNLTMSFGNADDKVVVKYGADKSMTMTVGSDGLYSNGKLTAEITDFEFDKEEKYFRYKITVYKGSGAGKAELESQDVAIRPV